MTQNRVDSDTGNTHTRIASRMTRGAYFDIDTFPTPSLSPTRPVTAQPIISFYFQHFTMKAGRTGGRDQTSKTEIGQHRPVYCILCTGTGTIHGIGIYENNCNRTASRFSLTL